jgi:hypothetical protein
VSKEEPDASSALHQSGLRDNIVSNWFAEEIFFFHKKSRTVILGDFIQNHPMAKGRPLLNAFFKLAGVSYPHGGVGLDIRLSFTNRILARRSLEKLLSWDFDKLIIAHGACIEKDAKPFVERAFGWLLRQQSPTSQPAFPCQSSHKTSCFLILERILRTNDPRERLSVLKFPFRAVTPLA